MRGLLTIAAIAALLLLAWPLLRRLMGRSGAVGGYVQRRSAEENTIELADWFGTGNGRSNRMHAQLLEAGVEHPGRGDRRRRPGGRG